jgi:hypothetical protein
LVKGSFGLSPPGANYNWLPFKENEMTTKKQLTPEQIAVLNLMVNGAFSSIAIHAIGDRVSKGIHKVADATQFATDKTAYAAGTVQICAIPAAKHMWTGFTGLFVKKTAATPASV